MTETYQSLLSEQQPGVLDFGGVRMAMLDIGAGFWGLRRQIEALVGPRLADSVLQQAGANGGTSFARAFAGSSGDAQALRDCIAAYQAAGFGQFEIEALQWPIGRVLIRAHQSFEAWAVQQHGQSPESPVCAYTAGVLVGFVNVLAGRHDIVCIERACQAQGAETCLFELLPAEVASDALARVVAFAPDPALGRQINLLEILFDRMPMGIVIFDRNLRIRRFNPTWAEFIARYSAVPAAQVVPGLGFFELVPDIEADTRPAFERVLSGETVRQEAFRLDIGGIVSYWDAVISPLTEGGRVVGIVHVTTDVTERVRIHQELEQRVQERTRELATLLQVSHDVNSTLELQPLLELILDQLKEVVDYSGASILTLEGEDLAVRAYRGPIPGVEARRLRFPLEEALVNREVIQQRTPRLIADVRDDTPMARMFRQTAGSELDSIFGYVRSWLGVPLMVKGEMLGMLTLDHSQPDHFTARQANLVLSFANQAAVAIENARLYRAEQEQLGESERRREVAEALRDTLRVLNSERPLDEILDHIVEQAVRLLGAHSGIIYRLDASHQSLVLQAGHRMPEQLAALREIRLYEGGAVRQMFDRKPYAIKDIQAHLARANIGAVRQDSRLSRWLELLVEHYQAYLGVPLIIGDEVYGSLGLYYVEPQRLADEEIELGLSLANQATLAIQNASLRQAEKQRRSELQTLLDITATASRSLDLDEMLGATLDHLLARVSASRAGVMLLDDASNQLEPRVIRPEHFIAAGDMAQMIEACQDVIGANRPLYVEPDPGRGLVEPGALLPLRARGQVIGVLVIVGPQGGRFSQGQQALFGSIADQLGIAVENARLFERAEEAAVAAERSRLARDLHDAVTQTLFSSSIIAEVLPRIWERDPEEGRRRLQELRELTRGALAEMRTLLMELRPSALVETRLADLLRQLAESITGRARVPVALEVAGECQLDAEVKVALYRIAQEALNNVAKHAGASAASMRLRCQPGHVELRVADDGQGFNPATLPPNSLGLGIMRERAEAIGASLTIESQPGSGTQIEVFWRSSGQ